MSNLNNLKTLITAKQRRLQKLKEKEATQGLNTPPEVLTEIEDLQAEIKKLQTEKANLNPAQAEQTPLPTSPSSPTTITQTITGNNNIQIGNAGTVEIKQ